MIPKQATATKLSSIRKSRARLCTYSMESMAISYKLKPELSELQQDRQSEKVENFVGSRLICLALDGQPTRNLKTHNAPVEPNVGDGKQGSKPFEYQMVLPEQNGWYYR